MISSVDVSIILPVFNNAQSLRELARRLRSAVGRLASRYELIFIDDGSRDNSLAVLRELALEHSEVKVIALSRNFGQHPAISAGLEHAAGETIVLMDADLQDRPEDLPNLIQKLRSEGLDIVYTVRQEYGGSSTARMTSRIYHYIFSKIVSTDVPENVGTYRAFNRRFLEALLSYKEINVLYGPLMFFMGYKSSFLEVAHSARPHGRSGYTFVKRLSMALNSLMSYTNLPHRVSVTLGLSILIASMIYISIVLVQYLLYGSSLPSGSTLILVVLMLTLGSVMTSLGIIGAYVYRVHQEVLRRPRYLVRESINFNDNTAFGGFSSAGARIQR